MTLKLCKRCFTMKNIRGKKIICKRCEEELIKKSKKSLEDKYGKEIVEKAIKCYIGQNYTLEEIEDLCKKIVSGDWY